MDDRMRHELGVYFQREARQVPAGVRGRVLARLDEAAAAPAPPRARRAPQWLPAVAMVLLAASVIVALVVANVAGRRQPSPAGPTPGPLPPPRSAAAATWDGANGTLVLFGGADSQGILGDTWTWNGRRWTQAHPAAAPPARRGALAVFDEAHRVVVLFGGSQAGATALADTWTWDGRTWTPHATPVAPPASTAASMVYDPGTRSVLLVTDFKGQADGLWRWDGGSWTRISTEALPLAGDLLYDGQRVLLVGGRGAEPARETWTWDGRTWARLSPATPLPSLPVAGTAFDRPRGRVVALLNGPAQAETWAWDGATWSRLHPADEPPASSGGELTAGPAGGLLWYGADGVIWTWDGRDWTPVPNGGGHG